MTQKQREEALCPGKLMMIELEIPRERILLSKFDDWHAVLNDTFLYSEDTPEHEALFQAYEDKYQEERQRALDLGACRSAAMRHADESLRVEREASWMQIFDGFEDWPDISLAFDDQTPQACVDKFLRDDVISFFEFTVDKRPARIDVFNLKPHAMMGQSASNRPED